MNLSFKGQPIRLDLEKGQVNIFGKEDVQKPGSRGGNWWMDNKGKIRYDERPKGRIKKENPSKQIPVGDLSTYKKAVRENLKHMGTHPSEWFAFSVKNMVETENDRGKMVMMPEFDFSAAKNFEVAPSLFKNTSSSSSDINCKWCGTRIKNAYHIYNKKKKWTMVIGSECISHFHPEGKSGKKIAKEQITEIKNDIFDSFFGLIKNLRKEYGREITDNRGRIIRREFTNIHADKLFDKIMELKDFTGFVKNQENRKKSKWVIDNYDSMISILEGKSELLPESKEVLEKMYQLEPTIRSEQKKRDKNNPGKIVKENDGIYLQFSKDVKIPKNLKTRASNDRVLLLKRRATVGIVEKKELPYNMSDLEHACNIMKYLSNQGHEIKGNLINYLNKYEKPVFDGELESYKYLVREQIKKAYNLINLTRLGELRKASAGLARQMVASGGPPKGNAKLQLLPSKNNPNIKRWQKPFEETGQNLGQGRDLGQEKKEQEKKQEKERPDFKVNDRVAFQLQEQLKTGKFSYGSVESVSDNYVGIRDDDGKKVGVPIDSAKNVSQELESKEPGEKKKLASKKEKAKRSKEVDIMLGEGKIKKGILLDNAELWQTINIGSYVDYIKLGELNENAMVNVKFGASLGVTTVDGVNDILHKDDVVRVREGRSRDVTDKYMKKVDTNYKKVQKQLTKLHFENKDLKKLIRKVASNKGVSVKEQEKINHQLLQAKEEKTLLQKKYDDLVLQKARSEENRLKEQQKTAKTEKERKEIASQIEDFQTEIQNIKERDYQDIRLTEEEKSKKAKLQFENVDYDAVDFQHAIDVMYGNLSGGLKKHRIEESWKLIRTNKPAFFNRMVNYAKKRSPGADEVEAVTQMFGDDFVLTGSEEGGYSIAGDEGSESDLMQRIGIDEEEVSREIQSKNQMAIDKSFEDLETSLDDLPSFTEKGSNVADFVQVLTANIIANGITQDEQYNLMFGETEQKKGEFDYKEPPETLGHPDYEHYPSDSDWESVSWAKNHFTDFHDELAPEQSALLNMMTFDESGEPVTEEMTAADMKEVAPILDAAYAEGHYNTMYDLTAEKATNAMTTAEMLFERLVEQSKVKGKEHGKIEKLKEKVSKDEREFLDRYLYKKPVQKAFVLFGRLVTMVKSQLGLFAQKEPAFVRKPVIREPLHFERKGNMALLPSKKNPKIKRWQRTDKDVSAGHEKTGELFDERIKMKVTDKETGQNDKADYLFKKIDENLQENASMDYHDLLSTMLSSISEGRLMRLQEHQEIINSYFQYSPEVFESVKNYNPSKLMKFLEKIIETNNKKAKQIKPEKKVEKKGKEAWEMTFENFLKNVKIDKQQHGIYYNNDRVDYGGRSFETYRLITNPSKIKKFKEYIEHFKENKSFPESYDKKDINEMVNLYTEFSGDNFIIPTEEYHKKLIKKALSEGKPVPDEVLKNYSELQKKTNMSKAIKIGTDSEIYLLNGKKVLLKARKLHKKYEFQGLPNHELY